MQGMRILQYSNLFLMLVLNVANVWFIICKIRGQIR
jgi:hypothetical protein